MESDIELKRWRLALAEARMRMEELRADSPKRRRLALEIREAEEQISIFAELAAGATVRVQAMVRESIKRRVTALGGDNRAAGQVEQAGTIERANLGGTVGLR